MYSQTCANDHPWTMATCQQRPAWTPPNLSQYEIDLIILSTMQTMTTLWITATFLGTKGGHCTQVCLYWKNFFWLPKLALLGLTTLSRKVLPIGISFKIFPTSKCRSPTRLWLSIRSKWSPTWTRNFALGKFQFKRGFEVVGVCGGLGVNTKQKSAI